MLVRKSVASFMLTGVLAVAAFSLVASAAVQGNKLPQDGRGLVGSWLLTVTFPAGFPTTTVLANFAASGVVTQVTLNPPGTNPGHGTWELIGPNQYEATVSEITSFGGTPVLVEIDSTGMFTSTEITANATFTVFLPGETFTSTSTATGTRT